MATAELPYARELRIAELAVQRASRLTEAVYTSKVKGTVTKNDKSPVTIADFGAQSVVFGALGNAFPDDLVLGEEDSSDLRSNDELAELVWGIVSATLSSEVASESSSELGSIGSRDDMIKFIDKGDSKSAAKGRVWTLDPIDGTKGFLRGGQYAIALALLVDGEVKVGVLGCPKLPLDPKTSGSQEGVLLSAVRGQGTFVKPLSSDLSKITEPQVCKMNEITSASEASFVEGIEAGHSSHGVQAEIAKRLGITNPSVRMDSQAKYATLAQGHGEIYLRLPVSMKYEEKIWDHAAGSIVAEEAGGVVTDMYGGPLDFTQGRTLKQNKGVIVVAKGIADEVIEVVKKIAEENYGPRSSL
ncbi:Inositol-1-monophosphatase [Dactylella cylindrospora]|nr:Inositol-1-monophosphatase [Dactylella cylindrospora]